MTHEELDELVEVIGREAKALVAPTRRFAVTHAVGLFEQYAIAEKAADVAEATANEWRRELERTKEQLEVARLALDEISRMGDSIGMAIRAREALSSPAKRPT